MAWARDERSFDVLKDLLGDAFDPLRHRSGVDVAFGLPADSRRRMPWARRRSGSATRAPGGRIECERTADEPPRDRRPAVWLPGRLR